MRALEPLDTHDLRTLACPTCGRTPVGATLGFKALRDGVVIGVLAASPASELGGFFPQGSVVITQMWVRDADVREMVGSQLVHRTAAVLGARKVRTIVASGTRGRPDCRHLPAGFLEKLSFVEFVPGIQWKLDLRRTVRVPELVRVAADEVARVVRPRRPMPASREL